MLKSFGGFDCLKVTILTKLSCRDNLLARKPRQTNYMLIHGRL